MFYENMTIGVGFTALHTLPLLQLFLNLTLHLLLLAAIANICQDLPSKFCYYHYHVALSVLCIIRTSEKCPNEPSLVARPGIFLPGSGRP